MNEYAQRETDGALLARLGTDGAAWAEAFSETAFMLAARRDEGDGSPESMALALAKLLSEDEPGDWLHGWFANAIEAGWSAGYSAAKREDNPDWPVAGQEAGT